MECAIFNTQVTNNNQLLKYLNIKHYLQLNYWLLKVISGGLHG